jgi:hypothetical protein
MDALGKQMMTEKKQPNASYKKSGLRTPDTTTLTDTAAGKSGVNEVGGGGSSKN